jgi:multiple sugar transport system permease protein
VRSVRSRVIRQRARSKLDLFPYILVLPAILVITLVILYPILEGIVTSFHYKVLTRPGRGTPFIGLDNYYRILFRDKVFWISLKNTFWWVLGSVSVQFVLGFLVALVLNQEFRFRGLVRGIVLIPWVIPGVIAALTWSWLLHGTYGVMNDILFRLGIIDKYVPWLAQSSTAMLAVIIANIWKGFPFFATMLLAGLQTIPQELYEAASIDGASPWQQFSLITVPMLKHVIVISTTLRIIWTTNNVDMIFSMTQGGPGHSTRVLALYSFMTAWSKLDFGYAAALGVILLLILMVLAVVYIRMTMQEEVDI